MKKEFLDIAKENKDLYKNNTPFAHIKLENIFPNDLLDGVLSDIEKTNYEYFEKFCTVGNCFSEFGESTVKLTDYLVGDEWVEFLRNITEIKDLESDKDWYGAGINIEPRGSYLEPHTDFNRHNGMWRRVNVLLFLSKDWKDEWGGHNELGHVEGEHYVVDRKYEPEFNNVVIFNTSNYSYHGFDLVSCPDDKNRMVVSCYYYSNERGDHGSENLTTNYIGWDKKRKKQKEYQSRFGTGWRKLK